MENIFGSNYLSRWQVIGASVCGTSHEKTGKPCQDFHGWEILSGNILIAAVADGAGSAKLGEIGAAVAVKSALEKMQKIDITGDIKAFLKEVFSYARTAIEMEALDREVNSRELATTLIISVATPDFLAAAQVGDGAVVFEDVLGNISALTAPMNSEFINETVFLISPGSLDNIQTNMVLGTPANMAIFSDGLQLLSLKMPDNTPHIPFFKPIFQFVSNMKDMKEAEEQLASFLRSPRITGRTDDDLTLILASLKSLREEKNDANTG